MLSGHRVAFYEFHHFLAMERSHFRDYKLVNRHTFSILKLHFLAEVAVEALYFSVFILFHRHKTHRSLAVERECLHILGEALDFLLFLLRAIEVLWSFNNMERGVFSYI